MQYRLGRLSVGVLDDRLSPAVLSVTTVADSGNDASPTPGSLRAVILQANATLEADQVTFNVAGGGPQTLNLSTKLPPITGAITLDATTQPGYGGTPIIRLSGSAIGGPADGLNLVNHTGSAVRGFVIAGFDGAGVNVSGGGTHTIQNNFLGTTATGTAAEPNTVGVLVTGAADNVLIGGSTDKRNVISGNVTDGVRVEGGAKATQIIANLIGSNADGVQPVGNGGNGVAVRGGATTTIVGSITAGSGNTFVSNSQAGVSIADAATGGTQVIGNRIGLDTGGFPQSNGGDGVRISGVTATGTIIAKNTIQRNKAAGIAIVQGSRFVRISENGINTNDGLGIQIDGSANGNVRPPVLGKVSSVSTGVDVAVQLTGVPNTKYLISLSAVDVADPSGSGEGDAVGPTTTVTTAADGTASTIVRVPTAVVRGFLTATSTNLTTNETSAFSNAVARPSTAPSGVDLAVAAAGSGSPTVATYNPSAEIVSSIQAFDDTITGGVRVGYSDFDRDGVLDLIVGTGPGGATLVRVIDGETKAELFRIQPFESAFTGGVYVAAGDVTGDNVPDIIISPDEGGGPRVRVISGNGFQVVDDYFGIEDVNFRGGARVAVGDFNNDRVGDVLVAAGIQGGPRVAVFDGKTLGTGTRRKVFNDFFVFEQALRNGAFVGAGDINGDGFADLIAGGGPGGGPRVTIFDGKNLLNNKQVVGANFFAGNDTNRGGVRVASRDLSVDGFAEVIVGDGPGGEGRLRVYAGPDFEGNLAPNPRLNVVAFGGVAGGVFVG